MNTVTIREFAPGYYERVQMIDTNPRPQNHQGVWGNGIREHHLVGSHSGLIAIRRHQIGGFEAWYTPGGIELGWGEDPAVLRVNLQTVWLEHPQIISIHGI